MATAPLTDVVTARPHRVTVVCWVSAVVVVVGAVLLAIGLEGTSAGSGASGNAGAGSAAATAGRASYGAAFTPVTRAMVALFGLFCGGLLLLLTRPRLRADVAGVRVRTVGGWRHLDWRVVRGVRMDEAAPWMVLDLADDETVPVLAVQASDGERARTVFRQVRALHERSRRGPGGAL